MWARFLSISRSLTEEAMFSRFVDISYEVKDGMRVWPGDPEVRIAPAAQIHTHGYKVTQLRMGTHTATHMDFPGHLLEKAGSKPELSSMVGPCEIVKTEMLQLLLEDDSFCPIRLIIKGIVPSYFDFTRLIARGLKLVGTEAQSIDEDGSLTCHLMLLSAGAVILEGLCLADVEEGRSFLIALPLRIDADDGSPARAVLAY